MTTACLFLYTTMAMMRVFVAIATTAALIELAMATNYTVGAPGGSWDLQTNLQAWASGNTFAPGDNLIFSYDSTHDVLEVTQANYNSCTASSPVGSYTSGNDVIRLTATGKRYFICGISGHCQGGMKVEIDTVSATGSPPSSSAPPSPPTSSPTPPGSSGVAGLGLHAKGAVGLGLGMLMALAF